MKAFITKFVNIILIVLKDKTTAGSIYHRTLLRLLFPVRMQKKVARDFRYDPRICYFPPQLCVLLALRLLSV